MILSMTAFARSDRDTAGGNLAWELRAVNHRYLELSLKLPEELRVLEPAVREAVGRRIGRGKLDVSLRFTQATAGAEARLDADMVRRVAALAAEVAGLAADAAPLRAVDYLRWPGVLVLPATDVEVLTRDALAALDSALTTLVATREREGARLADILRQRLAAIADTLAQIKAILPELVPAFRRRLEARVVELQGVDAQRLEQEIVLFAQRIDVQEEVDRLQTHIAEVQDVLKKGGQVGRRLDFLLQEFNREANTLASKSADMRLTQAAVALKVLIEQMREQVQNLE